MHPAILVVEDNLDIARLVKLHLSDLPAQVTVTHDGTSGLEIARTGSFDLLILDVSLPGMQGTALLAALRRAGHRTPALMLSGYLDQGLSALEPVEWMAKPFGVTALVERVRAMLCANAPASEPAPPLRLEHGAIALDLVSRRLTFGGTMIELSAKEFDLLALLAAEPGRVFTRRELITRLWGDASGLAEHVINTHIHQLRAKLESDPQEPRLIRAGPSGGYAFVAPPGTAH